MLALLVGTLLAWRVGRSLRPGVHSWVACVPGQAGGSSVGEDGGRGDTPPYVRRGDLMSAPNVTASSMLVAQLEYLIAEGGPLYGQSVHLYTNNLVPTNQTPLSAFTEVTTEQFPGYAAKAITWSDVFEDVNGLAQVLGGIPLFITDDTPPDDGITIYGAFVTDTSTGMVLAYAWAFAAPVNVTYDGQGLPVPVTYTVAGPG